MSTTIHILFPIRGQRVGIIHGRQNPITKMCWLGRSFTSLDTHPLSETRDFNYKIHKREKASDPGEMLA